MRTDAKIGFAILGVLVLVLMGFFVVNSRKASLASRGKPVLEIVKLPPETHIEVPTPSGDPLKAPDAGQPPIVNPLPPTNGAQGNGLLAQNNGQNPLTTDFPAVSGQLTPDEIQRAKQEHGGATGKAVGKADKKNHEPKTPDPKKAEDPALAVGQRLYTIRAGQTLTSIASDLYGDPQAWKQIKNANPGLNPSKLKVGLKIKIPDPAVVRPHPGNVIQASDVVYPDDGVIPLSEPLLTAGQTYRVRPGDTLYKLAKRFLGSGQRSDELYELNRGVIGTSSSHLRIGMVLRLPTAAGALSDAR